MIAVQEAYDIILGHTSLSGIERIPFENAVGRVLAEALHAGRDLPPFDRVAMDGIAIRYEMVKQGRRHFPLGGIIAAGDEPKTIPDHIFAVEIMTGAALPEGLDTVIRYEDLEIKDGVARILTGKINPGQNIHTQGKDNRMGDLLIPAGKCLSTTDISMLAAEGKAIVAVRKLPRFGIISSGDELVGVRETPLPHQIRRSNVYGIKALLEGYHTPIKMYHLKDNKRDIRCGLQQAFEENEVLLLVGGVSKGKFDFIPDVLTEMGAEKQFHRVSQRPGKPFWFGMRKETAIFALPGNPVSSIVGTVRYVIPWLRKTLGLNPDYSIPVMLGEDYSFIPSLTRFVEASLKMDKAGHCLASPNPGHGSGDFTRLVYSDGFIELPPGKTHFSKGEIYPFWRTGYSG